MKNTDRSLGEIRRQKEKGGKTMNNKAVNYLGWSIYRWSNGQYGVWYPDGHNTGKQYTSLAKAKEHIGTIEQMCSRDFPKAKTSLLC